MPELKMNESSAPYPLELVANIAVRFAVAQTIPEDRYRWSAKQSVEGYAWAASLAIRLLNDCEDAISREQQLREICEKYHIPSAEYETVPEMCSFKDMLKHVAVGEPHALALKNYSAFIRDTKGPSQIMYLTEEGVFALGKTIHGENLERLTEQENYYICTNSNFGREMVWELKREYVGWKAVSKKLQASKSGKQGGRPPKCAPKNS